MAVEPMGPVVVGVDGSYSALRAVDLAAEESAARLTPLVVMHVQTQAEDADEILDVAAARALAAHPGLAVSTVAVAGDPARALISRSRDAYLLVLGHRRDPPFPALPAGPVTTRVVNEAGCPVMVHRPVDPGRSARRGRLDPARHTGTVRAWAGHPRHGRPGRLPCGGRTAAVVPARSQGGPTWPR